MLMGSCFTEHIGKCLQEAKFKTLINPTGITYSPLSIAENLNSCLVGKKYLTEELFLQNEVWHHWAFHSSFSGISKEYALQKMNRSISEASVFLKNTDWLIVTMGSAFQYYFLEGINEITVANCHKVPAKNFKKVLCSVSEMNKAFENTIENIKSVNAKLKIIFTVSPVRHVREGIVANNHSKARLLETVHYLTEHIQNCFYFPAYEIMMDILRDYRFYEEDLVHPNNLAVRIIWEQYGNYYFSEETIALLVEIQKIQQACRHKHFFPETKACKDFERKVKNQIKALKEKNKYLNFEKEISLLQKSTCRFDD